MVFIFVFQDTRISFKYTYSISFIFESWDSYIVFFFPYLDEVNECFKCFGRCLLLMIFAISSVFLFIYLFSHCFYVVLDSFFLFLRIVLRSFLLYVET